MSTYIFPTSAELQQVEQVQVQNLTADDLTFQICPIRNVNSAVVMWEQQDNYVGLQQVRGLGGEPGRVKSTGGKRYTMEPGVYGEFELIDEVVLTMRRPYGQWDGSLDVEDLVAMAQSKLLGRRLDRIRYIVWTLLTSGTFSVAGPNGEVLHTDSYTTQTASFSAWATAASGTPLADLRAAQILSRGKGVSFGSDAMAIMNRTQANYMLANTNAADLGGRKGLYGITGNISLKQANMILEGEGLPQVVVYDETYQNESDSATLLVPTNKIVIVGRRPSGAKIMEYQMTRNVNTPNMQPGAYTKVIERERPPLSLEVHDGHSGGPALFFPGSIVLATAT